MLCWLPSNPDTMVQRPTLYGQTRDTYKIDGNIDGAPNVHFRRDEAAIDLTLAIVGTNAGTAKYTGDDATDLDSEDKVQFPGAGEGWQDELTPPTIINGGCVYCADDDGVERLDVALETAGVPTLPEQELQLIRGSFTKKLLRSLLLFFDTTVGVWDATAQACVEGGDGANANKPRAYCKSAQAAADTEGYLCQQQSVTFGLEVSKDSLDDRKQGQKITVPRTYSERAPQPIDPPTIDPRATTTAGHVEYIKSGADYAASFDKQPVQYVEAADQSACEANAGFTWDANGEEGKKCAKESDLVASDGTHSTAGLTFYRQSGDAGAKAYNCDITSRDIVYQADYNAICNGAASKIDYTVRTSVIYENQVAPSAVALQAGSSGVASNKIHRVRLQREGVDITFEITKSTEDGSLQYDSTSRLKVDHPQVGTVTYITAADKTACDTAEKTWDDHALSGKQCFEKTGSVTLEVVAAAGDEESAEGYCLLQSPVDGKANSMLCTLKGFQDPAYDPGHILSDDIL